MNPTLIRAVIYIVFNGLLNTLFVLSTVGIAVLGLLILLGKQFPVEPSKLVSFYGIIFVATTVWSFAYRSYLRKIALSNTPKVDIGEKGNGPIDSLLKSSKDKERAEIMARHGNDIEKAKKELVLLEMKYGGKS